MFTADDESIDWWTDQRPEVIWKDPDQLISSSLKTIALANEAVSLGLNVSCRRLDDLSAIDIPHLTEMEFHYPLTEMHQLIINVR